MRTMIFFLLVFLAACQRSEERRCGRFPVDPCGVTVYAVLLNHPEGCPAVLWSEHFNVLPIELALVDDPELVAEFEEMLARNGSPWIYSCN